jgi:hypothetical protein
MSCLSGGTVRQAAKFGPAVLTSPSRLEDRHLIAAAGGEGFGEGYSIALDQHL